MDYTLITIHDEAHPRRFRFDIKAAKGFEKDLGMGVNALLEKRQNILALSKLLFYGCRWDDRKLTEDQVDAELDLFVKAGGDIASLFNVVMEAVGESGTFGRAAPAASNGDGPPSDPLSAA